MFKTTSARTAEGYIKKIKDKARRAEIEKLHKLIRKTVPKLKPFIISGMVGYGPFHYKYASGREGDWATILLASQKNYISVYVCAAKDGKYVAEKYKKQLPKASIGRSCVRFKRVADLDEKVLVKMLLEAEKSGFQF